MKNVRIATRKSALALWQAEHVADRLRTTHAGLTVEMVPMTTSGDERLDQPLASLGGKGLFLKELQHALLDGRADLAVHSLKDMPARVEPGFAIGAILDRADPADAFVSRHHAELDALPHGARVGTSSLRRQALLRAQRPDLQLLDLRGNVNTRLARLDAGDYDAIILACAGLQRLGVAQRIRQRLTAPYWLPGVGQGAIAIEHRADNVSAHTLLAPLHDPDTAICVGAERALNLALAGDCTVPIGAYAELDGSALKLWGVVGDANTGDLLRGHAIGTCDQPEALGELVAEQLRSLGAEALLARAHTTSP